MLRSLAKFAVKDGHLANLVSTTVRKQQCRFLNVHENQAYTLLQKAGIPTPPFGVAKTPDEAAEIAKKLDTNDLVLKAQVLAGGRGKGRFKGESISGVQMCESPEEAKDLASRMIGKLLVTKQTGEAGKICNSVMVTTRMYARKEFYLSVMMERSFNGPVIIASRQGGVNIEDVAASDPDAITYLPIDVKKGLCNDDALRIACSLGVQDVDVVAKIVENLYKYFNESDALLLEINPLIVDLCNNYFAIDCKCNFDDSAFFRQKELFALKDWSQMIPSEEKAGKLDLNYISLDGNIGCMVNGAGLAMATMDIIKLFGGEPANFLDVGGGATIEGVTQAFEIISSDPKVQAIFVNIFGGIMRCDIIAEGVIAASQKLNLKIPVVCRLQGTNADQGKEIILKAKTKIIPIDDMTQAAETCVMLAQIVQIAEKLNLDIKMSPAASKSKKC